MVLMMDMKAPVGRLIQLLSCNCSQGQESRYNPKSPAALLGCGLLSADFSLGETWKLLGKGCQIQLIPDHVWRPGIEHPKRRVPLP